MKESRTKIAIVGAGWTGCHLARELLNSGYSVTVYEAADTVFAEASGRNQSRLHAGFHYPRGEQSLDRLIRDYEDFRKFYPQFIAPVASNIYAVAEKDSLTDFSTFCRRFEERGLAFFLLDAERSGIQRVEGALRCDEMMVDNRAAALQFSKELEGHLVLKVGHVAPEASGRLGSEQYDFIINCTANLSQLALKEDYYYQVCVMFRYQSRGAESMAVTIMDGEFASLYPCPAESGIEYVLSGVKEGVLSTHDNPAEALKQTEFERKREHENVRLEMEQNLHRFFPAFPGNLRAAGEIVSIKTRKGSAENIVPDPQVIQDGRLIHVVSFKISQIFRIEALVRKLIGTEPA